MNKLLILLSVIWLFFTVAFADDNDFPLKASTENPGCLETKTNKLVYYYAPKVLGNLQLHYNNSDSPFLPSEASILDYWEPLTVSSASLEFIEPSLLQGELIDEFLTIKAKKRSEVDNLYQVSYGTGRWSILHLTNFYWELYTLKEGLENPPLNLKLFDCALIPEMFASMPTPSFLGEFSGGPTIIASGP